MNNDTPTPGNRHLNAWARRISAQLQEMEGKGPFEPKMPILWDKGNTDHITIHNAERNISINQINQVLQDPNSIIEPAKYKDDELQYKNIGMCLNGGIFVVKFSVRNGMIRPITAYALSRKFRNMYYDQFTQE